jgi:hypothetical protein
MRWPKLTETQARMAVGALKGAAPGGAAGAAASLATGVAVVATAPAWLPVLGGAAVVSMATVGTCSAIGVGVGAATGAVAAYLKKRRTDKVFGKVFGDAGSASAEASKES